MDSVYLYTVFGKISRQRDRGEQTSSDEKHLKVYEQIKMGTYRYQYPFQSGARENCKKFRDSENATMKYSRASGTRIKFEKYLGLGVEME